MIITINKSRIVTNQKYLVCIITVNSDENREDDYIEFTLLLHCKLETKKNARVFDFSGVLEFLDEFRMITFALHSQLVMVLLTFLITTL